jgi:hypothetical protein
MTGLEFAIVALAGVLLGRFLPNRRKGPKPPQPVKPICGCGHHHGYHDPQTGACGHSRRLVTYEDAFHTKYGDIETCGCRQYSGPQPMPEFFAPEVTA